MCIGLLTNKFFVIGVFIYFLPSLTVLGYAMATMPREHGVYYPGTEYSPTFEFFFGIVLLIWFFIFAPISLLFSYPYIMIPYFAITYGLLYRHYKHEKAYIYLQPKVKTPKSKHLNLIVKTMKKHVTAAFLIAILTGLGICYFLLTEPRKSTVQVGAFYYVWYDPIYVIGQDRPLSWEYPKICDKPILGYYNSGESEIISQHFGWMSDLGINFIILSYFGHYNQTEWFEHCLHCTHQIFKVAEDDITNVKVCIMMEPFNWTENPIYDYQEIYDYIYENFVVPYPTVYFKYMNKPLLSFFNNPHLTPQGIYKKDPRFSMLIIGNDYYADWIYTDLIPVVGQIPRNRQVPVTPRFDDSRFRNPNYTIDIDFSEGVYCNRWKRAVTLAKQNAIDVITICSWNEYPERTAIEPHWDAYAYDHNPYFLFNKTKNYIDQLRGAPIDCEL